MAYPYDAGDLAAISRCSSFYNGNAYNASTNAGGMASGGHRVNFTPSLQDVARIAGAVSLAASAADSSASAASSSATSAANSVAALTGTSTTSVAIGTGSKTFTTQASKSFPVGSFVLASSDANPTVNFMEGQVTAYSGTTLTINATIVGGSGTKADWTILGRVGAPGVQGATGATGNMGTTPALQWAFGNGTSDVDPGNGTFLINNATYSGATFLYFDNVDTNGASATTWLDALDDSTTTSNRGTLFVQEIGTTHYAVFTVTGSVVDGTGYRKVPVSHVMSNGAFTLGAACAVTFQRTGNAGSDGVGAGDTISDISSVTDGRVALYSGTSGKHITNASYGIGTSGANLGALNAANTWSGAQSLAALLDVQQDFRLSGDISPTQITASQNDYAPTGGLTSSVWRLSTDASTRALTGWTGGADGRLQAHINVGSFELAYSTLTGSSSANQLSIGANVSIPAGGSALWIYDATSTKWRPLTFLGLGGDGSVSRPWYTFAADPDSGWYRIGANNIGLALDGAKVVDYSTTGVAVTGTLNVGGASLLTGAISQVHVGTNQNFCVSSNASTTYLLAINDAGSSHVGLKIDASAITVNSLSNGSFSVAASTASTSPTSGALVVSTGGLGVSGAIHAGGRSSFRTDQMIIGYSSSTVTAGYSTLTIDMNAGGGGGAEILFNSAGVNKAQFLVRTDSATLVINQAVGFNIGTNSTTNIALASAGSVAFPSIGTTGSAANAFLDGSNGLLKSTSSLRYKKDFEGVSVDEARSIILRLAPGSYNSLAPADDPARRFFGLGAEDVFEVSGSLVNLDDDGRPDGVMYDRVGVLNVVLTQEHEREIAAIKKHVGLA